LADMNGCMTHGLGAAHAKCNFLRLRLYTLS